MSAVDVSPAEVEQVFDIPAQEIAREEAARIRKHLSKQNDDDLREIMNTYLGRRWIYQLLDFAGMWRTSYTGNREDTFFREGSRNVALRVWDQLERVCPTLAHKMCEEQKR